MVLTPDNQPYDLDLISEDNDIDVQFCYFDMGLGKDADYYFKDLVFFETFTAPPIELRIGKHLIRLPKHWSILLGEQEQGALEFVPLEDFRDLEYKAFIMNPLSSFMPKYHMVEINMIYTSEVRWYAPKLERKQMLIVPLSLDYGSDCAIFADDINGLGDEFPTHLFM